MIYLFQLDFSLAKGYNIKMKYSIRFNGYWPVGAVAVVEAKSIVEAVDKLYNHSTFEPHRERNTKKRLLEGSSALISEVEILLDGEY